MTTFSDPSAIIGRTAVDRDGDKVGKVGQVYLDDETGRPAVGDGQHRPVRHQGELRRRSPERRRSGDDLRSGRRQGPGQGRAERRRRRSPRASRRRARSTTTTTDYLGNGSRPRRRTDTTGDTDTGHRPATASPRAGGDDTSGPNTDDAMTRSEERLHVGTEQVEAGRARLRKYVVTENVTQTVPVSHEEVRVEREPITDANVGDGDWTGRRSPRRSTRSPCTPSGRSSRRRPCRSSGCGSAPRPSPTSRPSATRSARSRSSSTRTPTADAADGRNHRRSGGAHPSGCAPSALPRVSSPARTARVVGSRRRPIGPAAGWTGRAGSRRRSGNPRNPPRPDRARDACRSRRRRTRSGRPAAAQP